MPGNGCGCAISSLPSRAGYTEINWRSVASLLGAFSKRVWYFGGFEAQWPFEAVKDRDARRWKYRMTTETAEAIKKLKRAENA